MKLASRLALVALLVAATAVPPSNAATTQTDPPHLVFSTFLGDTRFEGLSDIAVAPDGTIVGVGSVEGATVVRLSADGSRILGRRTIAGADPLAVVVGADGAIYVAGRTRGGLETVRPIQASPKSFNQAFVAKLSSDASQLLFCTYLGGSRSDGDAEEVAYDIEVDAAGLAYVVGTTQASNNDFPLVNPTQATFGGGYSDGFVSVVDPDSSTLVFSTYFGDEGDDDVKSVAVDPQTKTITVAGLTLASASARGSVPCHEARARLREWVLSHFDVPIWAFGEADDRCVKEFYAELALKAYNERIANEALRRMVGINSLFGGATPNTQQRLVGEGGGVDVEISIYDDRLNLLRTTLFGGPGDDYAKRVVVDGRGIIYLIGETKGAGFPTIDPFQASFGGGLSDSFVAAFDAATLQPLFSSYIGGSGFDFARGIALDADGNVLLAGSTDSANFPTTPNALHPTIGGGSDAWLTKVSALGDLVPDFGIAVDPPAITAVKGQSGTLTINIARTGGFTGRITVTAPDTKAIKVKLTPPSASTSGDSVTIKFKVKKKAQPGTYDLVFTAKDEDGRERSASVSLTIE